MKWKLIAGILVFAIVLTSAPSVAAEPAVVSIGDASASLDKTATAPITIENIEWMCTAAVELYYDNSVVIVESVKEGNFSSVTAEIDNDNGVVRVDAFTVVAQGVSGSFIFAEVTFKAVGCGESELALEADLRDYKNRRIECRVNEGALRVPCGEDEVGCIGGLVMDESGSPLKEASVVAKGEPSSGEDETDEEGYYEICNLKSGMYSVTASMQGYTPQTAEVEVIADERFRHDFELSPALRRPDLVIGTVWNEDNRICCTVKNVGFVTAPAGHDTALYIEGDRVSSEMVVTDLKPGDSIDLDFGYHGVCTPPADKVMVCADTGKIVQESNEDNNCLETMLYCPHGSMDACRAIAFSTEVDFITQGPVPPDGNPIISDGDLLGANCVVCARNHELLTTFQCRYDLGLDAVDVIDIEYEVPLVAFSTELDHPEGIFTAGDLLSTHGAVIPNSALLAKFDIRVDLGLDAVHFTGEMDRIAGFLSDAHDISRDEWREAPDILPELLQKYEIDIWFSTEGTAPTPDSPGFLDGDLLSVKTGVIVASNGVLLPACVPAGIPDRGVDFGLDAVTADRVASVPDPGSYIPDRKHILFSTEILYNSEIFNFTDGDIIRLGDGVVRKNSDLVKCFEPKALELGLDALSVGTTPKCVNRITNIGGLQTAVADIGVDGRADLWYPQTDHPFGRDIPFWGNICDDVTRFRVVYRKADSGPGNGTGIDVQSGCGWMVKDPMTGCATGVPWSSDSGGWYDAVRYRELLPCNPLILTNWNTQGMDDGLYRVWLEYERGGIVEREPVDHFVRVDNTPPEFENLEIPNGTCPLYGDIDMNVTDLLGTGILVRGQFSDDHFWKYRLRIGGDAYGYHYYNLINYYDSDPKAANLDDTGTTPDGTLVDLHRVSVHDLVTNPMECAYSTDLLLWDRTVVGAFYEDPYGIGGYFRSYVVEPIYFSYVP
ncbi:MAG: carboxypeptidase regulatory-like domain-containing protein [Euryarchaeota archaeon]|nr:carboxypeptidase regulatory-like domain-containing protein [Euryarchaeota archaeon]